MLLHLVDGNISRCISDRKKETKRSGKIENVKKKIDGIARKAL